MQQRRIRQVPPSTFPFEVIKPNGNVLSVVFGTDDKDPLKDSCIPYQMRQAHRNIRRELENKLEEFRWLLIVGRTGLGKTREAAELVQIYNREGWTVLWLKSDGWIDEPTKEQLQKIGTNRKLLFFLDDINQRMHSLYPRLVKSELAPLMLPLQERLGRVLEVYEKFYGQAKVRVIATARNERDSEILGEPSEWEKLEWERYYQQWWQRFEVYELPEPEKEAIVQLLSDTASRSQIDVKEEDYSLIAEKNDSTFTNVVENLRRLRNRGLSLTSSNYIESCKDIWEKCYGDAVKKYFASRYIYDAVDLLQQLHISLERFILEPTTLLMLQGNSSQELWHRWRIPKALNYLIETERILSPRKGQIEAKGRQVETGEYIRPLSSLVLEIADRYPQKILGSLFDFGRQLLNLNCSQAALTCFNKLINFYPEISEIWFYRGVALYLLGRHAEAVASYEKALAIKPELDQAWYNRSLGLYFLGRYEEAVTSYDKALAIKPDQEPAYYNRGVALYVLGRYEEAIASYNKGLVIKPDYYQAWYSRGLALGNLGRYEEAIASYDKALAIKPDYYQAWYSRGLALANLGCYEKAVASYDQALAIKPDYYQAWYSRGVALGNLKRYEEVFASCNKALAIKPDYYQAWYNRGNALYFLGRYEETVASYDKVLLIKPDLDQVWYNRSVALYLLGLYKEAIASCDKALAIKPDYHQVWYNRGNALYLLGHYKEAVASYDQAVALKPDYYQAWYNWGLALASLGCYEEAIASYDKALAIKPDYHQAWYNRGNALNQLGCYEQALLSLNKAIELAPDSFSAHYDKACCYALQENIDLTLENLKQAINLNPECREMAKTDSDFERILPDQRFQALITNG
jgi:tetratricopeptide (TPR) repeat protein